MKICKPEKLREIKIYLMTRRLYAKNVLRWVTFFANIAKHGWEAMFTNGFYEVDVNTPIILFLKTHLKRIFNIS